MVGRGRNQRERLFVELAARHEPVERVLERARNAESILWAADQHSVGRGDLTPPQRYGIGRRLDVDVGVKVREAIEGCGEDHLDVGGCQPPCGLKERQVRRCLT
jgi:hypothetical protein